MLIFAVTLPTVPGFFGVIQAAMVLALQPFGVSSSDAFAISVFYHMVQYIPVTVAGLVLGDRTSSKLWQAQLREGLDPAPPILLVDEHRTSLLARDRYWQMYPARGLTRLLPQGLREPPRAIDDIVAILLVERYLAAAQPLPG
ncbi:MAG: resolvase [Synechococcales cyanobacterium CRU_2_2]|nr:resolvase [Synechococcales cyanobacterium CRU_2_2]